MNLREAICEYVVGRLRWHEVIGMVRRQRIDDGDGVERIRRQAFEAGYRLDRAVKVAEAAIAYAAFQSDAGRETGMDGASYIRERGKLLDAFIEARAKAANQS